MTLRGLPCGIFALAFALGAVASHAATWEVAEGALSGRYPGYGARYYGLPSMILVGAAGASIAASLIGLPASFDKVLAGAALVLTLAALGFQVACFFAFGPQQATLTLENVTVEGIGRLPGSQSQQIGFQTRAGWGLYLTVALTVLCALLVATKLNDALRAPNPSPEA